MAKLDLVDQDKPDDITVVGFLKVLLCIWLLFGSVVGMVLLCKIIF